MPHWWPSRLAIKLADGKRYTTLLYKRAIQNLRGTNGQQDHQESVNLHHTVSIRVWIMPHLANTQFHIIILPHSTLVLIGPGWITLNLMPYLPHSAARDLWMQRESAWIIFSGSDSNKHAHTRIHTHRETDSHYLQDTIRFSNRP